MQKQSPEMFYKKAALKIFAKFTGKHLCRSLSFNKAAVLSLATSLKKRLRNWCFPVNSENFLKISCLRSTSGDCF